MATFDGRDQVNASGDSLGPFATSGATLDTRLMTTATLDVSLSGVSRPRADRPISRFDWWRAITVLVLLIACVCLTLGIFMPIIQLRKFVFWTEQHSLIGTVAALWRDKQTFLAGMVVVFSILLPFLKLGYLLVLAAFPDEELKRVGRSLSRAEWLGRLSMHDVLVLALTIFFMKTTGIYDASSLSGVYLYTAAVVLIIAGSGLLHGKLRRMVETTRGRSAASHRRLDARRWTWRAHVVRLALSLLVIGAAVSLALGIFRPSIRLTTVYVWPQEHSIYTIIAALWKRSEFFLGGVVLAVSVCFPVFKLWYLLLLAVQPLLDVFAKRRMVAVLDWLGRYSMTDVMVVALMIFYVNSSGYVAAEVLPGLYWFAASVLLTMIAYAWVGVLQRQHE